MVTKPSTILVNPVTELNRLPLAERQIVSRFLFDCVRGLDAQHDKRWRRLWNRMWRAAPGEVFHLELLQDRCGPFHRMHMGMEQRLFEAQERFTHFERFRDWLKTGAGHGRYEIVAGRMKFVPASTSYEACSDDEMRELHGQMLEFLHTPRAQRRLWPHLDAEHRAQMLESVLNPPTPET